MNVIEYRLKILRMLYEQALNSGDLNLTIHDNFFDELGVSLEGLYDSEFFYIHDNGPLNYLNFNLGYLESKGYIKLDGSMGNRVTYIILLAQGIDVVEFAELGSALDDSEKRTKFDVLIDKITGSGSRILEGSTVGAINIALSQLFK